jgi:hypothetical protein
MIVSYLQYLLQAIRLKYLHPDNELQNFALPVMDMLRADNFVDAHALVFHRQICCFYFSIMFFFPIT